MSRRPSHKPRVISPDPIYDSRLIHMFVNRIMKDGKKTIAYRIVYSAMNEIREKTQQDPIKVIEQAVRNVSPLVEVKARRVGGSVYQVPLEVAPERGTALAMCWILSACASRPGRTMAAKLTNEFIDASNNTGNAIRKRDEVHRTAEANQAFAKFRF
jgi:small subunit ribosomal protein S7